MGERARTRRSMREERAQIHGVLEAAERARMLREFVAAREDERRELWEGLHDKVLQTTAGNLLRLDAARVLLDEGRIQEARALLAEAARTERQVFDDLRRLMTGMRIEPSRRPWDPSPELVVSVPEPEAAPPVG